jgi:hypothetical protein
MNARTSGGQVSMRAGSFAVLQGDDEFGPLAADDVEDTGFPWAEGCHGGRA